MAENWQTHLGSGASLTMDVKMHDSWKPLLQAQFEQPYFKKLTDFIQTQYQAHTCYPATKDIFAAFDQCPLPNVRVVLLGQDPYHGPGQAQGLCFSVPQAIKHPPSLINIFKELETDVQKTYPQSGDLSHWAKQGVLLLNVTLTVQAHQAGSHQKQGWETFTDAVISELSKQKNHLVFLLWGGFAKKKSSLIDAGKHTILTSGHPSPLSANRGYWFSNQHFSQTNQDLVHHQSSPIQW